MGCKTLSHTDDIAIAISGKFGKSVSEVVLSFIEDCCNREDLSVNSEKTTFISFTKENIPK